MVGFSLGGNVEKYKYRCPRPCLEQQNALTHVYSWFYMHVCACLASPCVSGEAWAHLGGHTRDGLGLLVSG